MAVLPGALRRVLPRRMDRRLLFAAGRGVPPLLAATGLPAARRLAWRWEDAHWAHRTAAETRARNEQPAVDVAEGRLRFGPHPRQQVLWFAPRQPVVRRGPLLAFIHGGGWRGGGADDYRFLGRHFAARGFGMLIAGYRLLPEVTLPNMLADLVTGVEAGLGFAGEEGWDGPLTVIGQSAGAHLGALLTFGDLSGLGVRGEAAKGVTVDRFLSLCGVLNADLIRGTGLAATFAALVGPDRDAAPADPLRHLATSRSDAQVLCVHGRRDPSIDPAHSRSFVAALARTGRRARYMAVPNAHHADLIEVLYRPSPAAARVHAWLSHPG